MLIKYLESIYFKYLECKSGAIITAYMLSLFSTLYL